LFKGHRGEEKFNVPSGSLQRMNQMSAPLPAAYAPGELGSLLHAPPAFVELLPVAAYACDGDGRVLPGSAM
jgi:hypothetical protein